VLKKTYYRYFNLRYPQVTLKNGEQLKRDFLMYSESKGVIFCGPCLLFGNKSAFATTGFSNWQKAEERILEFRTLKFFESPFKYYKDERLWQHTWSDRQQSCGSSRNSTYILGKCIKTSCICC